MNFRLLQRDEILLVWQIDRREVIENVYYLPEDIHLEYVIPWQG